MDALILNSGLDREAFRLIYRQRSRVHIRGFLDATCADLLFDQLCQTVAWTLTCVTDQRVTQVSPEARRTLPPEEELRLAHMSYRNARQNFGFLYEKHKLPDAVPFAANDPLCAFVRFINSGEFGDFIRDVTDVRVIGAVSAQATRYRTGDFLTFHTDQDPERRIAYVMNLTPVWRPDWGGNLEFRGTDGNIEEAFVPCFNALNLFSVPQPHSVSCVAPFAGAERYSVSGWIHTPAE